MAKTIGTQTKHRPKRSQSAAETKSNSNTREKWLSIKSLQHAIGIIEQILHLDNLIRRNDAEDKSTADAHG